MGKCHELKLFSTEIDLKKLSNYPKQENEHNALSDAHFCYNFHKFLENI
jgi:hypothetical protein